jgi:putative ABC transport system permease protein
MIAALYHLRSLWARKASTTAAAGGVALVVFVFTSVLMLSDGIRQTMAGSGDAGTVIVVSRGAPAELMSYISNSDADAILARDEVARDARGVPVGAAEVTVALTMEKAGGELALGNVVLRGLGDGSLALRPDFSLRAGRKPRVGADELLVGEAIVGRFKGVAVGGDIALTSSRSARIVGVFSAGGSTYDSELWGDIDLVRTAFKRDAQVSSVRVKLVNDGALRGFKRDLESKTDVGLEALREDEFFDSQSSSTASFVAVLGLSVAALFSIGAIVGVLLTMHSFVGRRVREIGTMRALGFSRASILGGLLLESIAVTSAGGAVGALAALGMSAFHFSTTNLSSFAEITYSFRPSAETLLTSFGLGVVLGVLGGLLPALRAARLTPIDALRSAW